MSDTDDLKSIDLPESIVSRIEHRLQYTEWDSKSEYVTFVMESVLSHVEDEVGEPDFDTVDEKEVENRLEALGYLNS